MPDKITYKALPPKEAIDYFRKKGYKIGFDWRDTWKEEHAHAFTVAKAMRNDILQDIRAAMDDAIANGTTFNDFSKRLKPTLTDKGWWGEKLEIDPLTGEEKIVQLGSARRLRTIYNTNMRTAYAAGQWERIQRTKRSRPYLRYIAVLDERTREQHRGWHDIILPIDHPFWQKFYPPNGWGCRCSVQQLSERDLERLGLSVTDDADLPTQTRTYQDKRNGRVITVPSGISPGFDFNPGQARLKAMTPPPLDKPLDVPYHGEPSKVPLPSPRKITQRELYPDGLEAEEYVEKFLKEFGATIAKPVTFKDVTGEQIIISADLFRTASGRWKVTKDMRFEHLDLLANALKAPDEIWQQWEEYPKGRWTLRRKYLSRFITDKGTQAFALFDTNEKGWVGVTIFPPEKEKYLEKQRSGALIYRKEDP